MSKKNIFFSFFVCKTRSIVAIYIDYCPLGISEPSLKLDFYYLKGYPHLRNGRGNELVCEKDVEFFFFKST